jgi:peptidoglycan/xylan/chitin deacetylase (PgdA/CDA1 family)
LISPWKRWLLPAYYYGTWPLRRFASSLASAAGLQPIAVLFYHRVADDFPNPWTISNQEFLRQIDYVTSHFEVISLADAQQRIRRHNRRPAVCITFDDGYADNCRQALPTLISRGIPCTYFVATRFILRGEPFPHDAARGVPLAPNTVEQLRSMAAAGVEIGAHTRTHCDLGRIADPQELRSEVIGSQQDLQDLLGQPIRYFAFPFGQPAHLNREVFTMAREAGMAGVCSAYGGYNFPGDDAFHVQRLHADPYFPRFKNWLTMDPRLLANRRRYEYGARCPIRSGSSP